MLIKCILFDIFSVNEVLSSNFAAAVSIARNFIINLND